MKLSIGQVSKLYDISKDTLRHYDKIGLLKPEVNKENGYRYYSYKHLDQLDLILWTKYLGISLADIKETIESEDLEEYKKLVKIQQNLINDKIKYLKNLQKHLDETDKTLNEVTHYKKEYDFSKIEITNENSVFYGMDIRSILDCNTYIDYIKGIYESNKDKIRYYYLLNMLDDETIIEDEDVVFIKEEEYNQDIIQKYFSKENSYMIKKEIREKVVKVKVWGNKKEINEYILSINKYFKERNIEIDKSIFVNWEFYLPKKTDDEQYFSEILMKVK